MKKKQNVKYTQIVD